MVYSYNGTLIHQVKRNKVADTCYNVGEPWTLCSVKEGKQGKATYYMIPLCPLFWI
jgi:hypothetical protein